MKFASIRIITADMKPILAFYEKITGLPAIQYTEDFAEFHMPSFKLAIGSTRTLELFGGAHLATPASNRSLILEFQVNDVDAAYHNLEAYLGDNIVQIPTTMPWGNRSMLFRDTDGNLVNFFTPVTPEANERAN
jgi:catechol 2,3-dioxygenase-like lactoylglutathione lyase family enzyme